MAWSPIRRTVLVSNLVDGVDLYKLDQSLCFDKRLVVNRIRCNVPQQVGFAQNDEVIVCGSDRGEVYLWDSSSDFTFRTLRHGSESDSSPQRVIRSRTSLNRRDNMYTNNRGKPTTVPALPNSRMTVLPSRLILLRMAIICWQVGLLIVLILNPIYSFGRHMRFVSISSSQFRGLT